MDTEQAQRFGSLPLPSLFENSDESFVCPPTPIRRPYSINGSTISADSTPTFKMDLVDQTSIQSFDSGSVTGSSTDCKQKISFFQFLEARQIKNKRKKSI